MACGTPVVAAHAGSVPEVAGTAAILLPVDEGRQWRDALSAMLSHPTLALEHRAQGLARASLFSWERTALDTLACYRRVAGDASGSRLARPTR
jgi:glycosyltransferase involved in cell wall biosynthesis